MRFCPIKTKVIGSIEINTVSVPKSCIYFNTQYQYQNHVYILTKEIKDITKCRRKRTLATSILQSHKIKSCAKSIN